MKSHIAISVLVVISCSIVAYSDIGNSGSLIIADDTSQKWNVTIDGDVIFWLDARGDGYVDIYGYNIVTETEFFVYDPNGKYSISNMDIDGNTIVWSTGGNPYDIYGYNLSTGTDFPLCTSTGNQTDPHVSGDIVVWNDQRNNNGDVYGYNLSTETEFPICTNPASQHSPAVSGNIVVWADYRNGNYDIYGYDLSTQKEFEICTHIARQTSPLIDGNIVVWIDDRNGNYDIYGYDLSTQTEFDICTIAGHQNYFDIGGDFVVWGDQRNGNTDIYGYFLPARQEFEICTNPAEQYAPAISNSFVVWLDGRPNDTSYNIYGLDLSFVDWTLIANSGADCISAIEVFDDTPVNGSTDIASGTDISSCGYNDIYDVWHKYSPDQGGTVTISTENSTFDTVLSVFEACGGAEIACNDDYSLDHTESKVVLDVVKGKTYYIRIAGFDGQRGEYDLLVTRGSCTNRPQSDINDDCKVDLADLAIMASEWLLDGTE